MAATPQHSIRQFAINLLHALGNSHPSKGTIDFLVGWMTHESGASLTNGCFHNNPLSVARSSFGTTPQGCGAGSKAGVNSFPNYNTGVQATASRLHENGYGNLLKALQTNNTNALGITASPSSGIASDLSYWLNGTRTIAKDYVNTILSLAGSVFRTGGGAGTASTGGGGGGGSSSGGSSSGGSSSSGSSSSGGSTTPTSPTQCLPWDVPCLMNELVKSDYFERGILVTVGLVIVLIGIVLLVGSKGATIIEEHPEAAAAAAV